MKENSPKYWSTLFKVAERVKQDRERSGSQMRAPLCPAVRCHVKFDKYGRHTEECSLAPSKPGQFSSAQLKLAYAHLESHIQFHLGKNLPQKRVKPMHYRDKSLSGKPVKTALPSGEKTTHFHMDTLIFKETEKIGDPEEFCRVEKKRRKTYIQARYRFRKKST